jgi:uncharacterized membrane protein
MLYAAVGDTWYQLLLFLHLLTVIVAFAPGVAHALLLARLSRLDGTSASRVAGAMVETGRKVYAPALIAAGLFGILLILASGDRYSFADTWVSISFVLWFAMNGVLHALILPGQRKMSTGDTRAESRVNLGNALLNAMLVIIVIMMIWTPGAG